MSADDSARREADAEAGRARSAQRTRNLLTVASLVYIAATVWLFTVLPLRTFNVLLATTVVPLVWLVLAFCRWSAHQHSNSHARDIANVHGGRPTPLPERAR